jgi:hypothetical protein
MPMDSEIISEEETETTEIIPQDPNMMAPRQDPLAPTDSPSYVTRMDRGRERTNLDWLNVRVGGGLEGLGGTLNDQLSAGPLWSAAVGVQPLSWMGAELGYSGSTHEVDSTLQPVGDAGATGGADFVRNGGQANVTFNVPTRSVQPYALTGIGFDSYNWRGPASGTFRDDTAGRVPLGVGLKGEAGPFVADLRWNYNLLFDQEFARTGPADDIGGTWDLGLQIGAQF